jgi:hypothetical protein
LIVAAVFFELDDTSTAHPECALHLGHTVEDDLLRSHFLAVHFDGHISVDDEGARTDDQTKWPILVTSATAALEVEAELP